MIPWPGGCTHSFHPGCIARLHQHHEQGTAFCPYCYILEDGSQRPSPCLHGRSDLCFEGCSERCRHNLWIGLTGCHECIEIASTLPCVLLTPTTPTPTDVVSDGQLVDLMRCMDTEFATLARQGMPNGYRWSALLNPFLWAGLSHVSDQRVIALFRRYGLWKVRRQYQRGLVRFWVRTPIQLLGWLRLSCEHIQRVTTRTLEEVRGTIYGLRRHGYLPDYVQ